MKKQLICLIGVLLLIRSLSAQISEPFAIAGLKNWLLVERAESADSSLCLRDKLAAEKPPFVINAPLCWMNYNPAVLFKDREQGQHLILGNTNFSQISAFTVAWPLDTAGEKCLWALEVEGSSQLVLTTRRLADLRLYRYLNFGAKSVTGPRIVTCYGNANRSLINTAGEQALRIGGRLAEDSIPVSAFEGSIGEILLFDRILSGLECAQVETYLSIKYGITRQGDYFDSQGNKIWDAVKHTSYSRRICGIGRDDAFQLHQKQSRGSEIRPLLSIGAGGLFVANTANPNTLPDRSFLLWGDNNRLPFFDENTNDSTRLLSTRWLLTASGENDSLLTTLHFAVGQLAERANPDETYWLAIERSGTGVFSPNELIYLPGEMITGNDSRMQIGFRNVEWDTDKSGSDAFTLALRTNKLPNDGAPGIQDALFEAVELWPNPSADGFFQVSVKLKEVADLDCRIIDTAGKILFSTALNGSDRYFFTQFLPLKGAYLLTLSGKGQLYTLPLLTP